MSLFGSVDQASDKPKWLTAAEKTNCLGADATETAVQATSGKVAHQGWTVPAGGNGNVNAQRETLVCCHITSDASDDATLPDA